MTDSVYLNLDLLIERDQEAYRVKAMISPKGETNWQTFSLPFKVDELRPFYWQFDHKPRGFFWNNEDKPATPTLDVKKIGEHLFYALFSDETRDFLVGGLQRAESFAGLRIRLRLNEVPELANLPWEYLYDPRQDRNCFFALSRKTPIVRYLEVADTTQEFLEAKPLRVLVMIANPKNVSPQLEVEKEWSKLVKIFQPHQDKGLIKMDRLESATLASLRQELRRTKYHVFHFIGHGRLNPETQEGELLLLDDPNNANAHFVSVATLKTHIIDHTTLQLAFLNACEGARGSVHNIFTGMAQGLVQGGMPAVVAMQFPVTDEAAIELAHEFYAALLDGYPVDAALAEARKCIKEKAHEYPTEWGTPVLFMRSPDGRLFDPHLIKQDERYHNKSIGKLILELQEWKIIHSEVQNLLFSTNTVSDALRLFIQDTTERHANAIEDQWISYCEPKAKRIRNSFKFKLIVDHPVQTLLNDLRRQLQGKGSTPYAMQHLNIEDTESVRRLVKTFNELVATLREILTVADFKIVQIADTLIANEE